MHIHVIRTRYPHWGRYSGINQYLRYLDLDTFQISERLASDNDEDFPIQNPAIRNRLRRAVQKRGMAWYKLSDLAAEMDAFRRGWAGSADIIHYLDGEHSAQYLPGLFKRFWRSRPKLVASYHQPSELLDALIRKEVASRLDGVTVVSPDQVAYFQAFLPADRISLIPHGIDTDFFRPGVPPRPDGSFRCITVGHYLRDFNAVRQVAIKLREFREIEFHVVSSQARELSDLANVKIHTGIDDAGLLKLYQTVHLLFLPLVQATANNALLEGIACGLAGVLTDLPSVRYYLPDGAAILVPNNDPDRFAEAIRELARRPDHLARLGQAARKRAEELDWRRISPEYQALYAALVDR
ncbi:MAG: glycosyltransferase family 4 protein [Nitrospirae bacterium]|nr:glycosyltransferase family 4 protein [Nitrospirota bacterium]